MRRPTVLLVALLAAVVIAAGCSKARSDDAIANDIKARMFSDAGLKDANLQVNVKDGEATLSGDVPSDAARYEAFKVATNTPGVKKVTDQMNVQVVQATPVPARERTPAPAPERRSRARTHHRSEPVDEPPAAAPAPAPAPVEAPAPQPVAAPPPPPQPTPVEIPAGTTVSIRMIDSIDSSINHTGEVFHASLDAPLVAHNQVIVPQGADLYARLVEAHSAGHLSGQSELRLELVRLKYQGKSYPLVSSTYDLKGTSRGKRTAATIGVGSAIGAAIGAIAGGGKGAAIGAGTGAGAGTIYQGVTKGQQVRIPSETKIDFRLEQPLDLTYMPGGNGNSE